MFFRQLFDDTSSTYTYLIADEATREAVIIDPVKEHVADYLALLAREALKLKFIYDTHVHADHVTGAGDLRDKTGAQTAMYEATKANCVSLFLKDGETLHFGSLSLKTIHTPGHTPCSACFLIGDRVFTGDSLMAGVCGRTDFQGGSAAQLYDSITQKLFTLPPDTLVYPGHAYDKKRVSTIRQEMDTNSRIAGKTQDEFIAIMNSLNLPPPKMIQQAVPANEKCGEAD